MKGEDMDIKRYDFDYRIAEVMPMLEEKQLYGTKALIRDLKTVVDEIQEIRAKAIDIVNQFAEEYNNDMVTQLAMMYAKNLYVYGVDVTKVWETATSQSMALEQAYLRGRQYERDRFAEWQEEHNNGWIPCSERLPDIEGNTSDTVLVCTIDGFQHMAFWCDDEKWRYCESGMIKKPMEWTEIIAWMPLPAPYKKGE